ncbi:MAG: ABC transporter permease [Chlorobi bacterium]|nr:ABC transporter permease [Chlorobiota bacterium]
MKKPETFNLLFIALGGVILLFLFAPLVGMIFKTPLNDLFSTAKEQEVQKSIILTLLVSFCTTLIFAIAAIPLSYLLARKKFTGKKLIMGLISLPIVIPHSAAGIAILGFISRDTIIGKIGASLGLNFVGSSFGIGLAMAFVSLPFLINAAVDGFLSVPVRLEKAAFNLGANSFKTFFSISLPLAWRSILSGLILMFARGMSEFGAVVIVAYHPMITPVMIYERFSAFGLKYARPVAVIFILISLLVFIVFRVFSNKSKIIKIRP